ncbi:hypothetical protein BASA81_012243 [Batrachochytrium salamandrivorans]|nr:hypothetical protein BASA81_012243 [Batrachochytrium salamandrivorans]
MASAGLSETLGDADYTAHQLEKRDIVDDMKKQLEEGDRTRHERLRDYSWRILGHEASRITTLKPDYFKPGLRSEDSDYGPSGQTVNDKYYRARVLYESHHEACYEKYLSMMKVKEKLEEMKGELMMLNVNQQKLNEHNKNHPNDLWTTTASTHFNRHILVQAN